MTDIDNIIADLDAQRERLEKNIAQIRQQPMERSPINGIKYPPGVKKINDNMLLQMIQEGKQQKEIAEYFSVSPAAICQRLRRLTPTPLPASLEVLTEKERTFAIEKAKGATATQAAMKSYECSSLQSAKVIGSQLMAKPGIREAIDTLMENEGLTRAYRIKKLKSHVDHVDPNVSLKAIDLANKMDASYIETRLNLNVNTPSFINVDLSEFGGTKSNY